MYLRQYVMSLLPEEESSFFNNAFSTGFKHNNREFKIQDGNENKNHNLKSLQ